MKLAADYFGNPIAIKLFKRILGKTVEKEAAMENALICIPFLILYLVPLIKDISKPPYGKGKSDPELWSS